MPAFLRFILGFLADWLKRLSDPDFERKQAEVHREVREREEAAKVASVKDAERRAESEKIDRERETLATDLAATQVEFDHLERRRKEMRSEVPNLENLSDRDAVRARLPLE